MNFPPDYPKMPGEPPRVQPSKRRADKADSDYLAPRRTRRDARVGPAARAARVADARQVGQGTMPEGEVLFEPKWDGFRSIVFRSGDLVEIGSRNEKPMTRYFPEVVEAVLANLPEKCVVDGEIVVIGPGGDRLDFDLLQQRIHPAASRVSKLSQRDAGALRRLRPPRAGGRGPDVSGPSPSAGRCSRRPSPGPRRRSTSPPPRATARSPRTGSSSSRARASTAWSPSRSTGPTNRTSG